MGPSPLELKRSSIVEPLECADWRRPLAYIEAI